MRRPYLSLPKKLCLFVCLGLLIQYRCLAQCVNNLATKTYDTTLTNNGFAIYNLSMPKFDPDSGQLVSVRLAAAVTNTYGFTLRNVNTVEATYQLTIGQDDQFSVPGNPTSTTITPLSVGTYTLQPGESQTVAPFPFLTNHVSVDSITGGTTPFLGTGNISYRYMSFAYTNLYASNNASYYFSNSINSTTNLSMQYLYCKSGVVLAANLTGFTAALTAPGTVMLDWTASNETSGRQYEIQRSTDGRSYSTLATQAANVEGTGATYAFTDRLPGTTTGSIYYRLQINDHGNFSWSPVRTLSLEAAGQSLRIYPNPAAEHVEIATGTEARDWQVDVFSASGGLVQHESFTQSNLLHLPFKTRLSAGVYFLRLTDIRGQKSRVSSFTVGGN